MCHQGDDPISCGSDRRWCVDPFTVDNLRLNSRLLYVIRIYSRVVSKKLSKMKNY